MRRIFTLLSQSFLLFFLIFTTTVTWSLLQADTVMMPVMPPTAYQPPSKKDHTNWNILIYVQADNNLAPFAFHNIEEIARLNFDDQTITISIQWYQPNKKKVSRYKVLGKGMLENQKGFVQKKPNPEKELIDAMKWAVESSPPSDHYMLIFWNHGNGILDQALYRNGAIQEESKSLGGMPWLEIPGLKNHYHVRGILYSESNKSYMNNQQLRRALATITASILKGKKIDIIGMDACLMSMVEVAYQIKDHATILVGSQNLEPGKGWDYTGFLKQLLIKPDTKPPELAKKIVQKYGRYYKYKLSIHTQSAINLNKIEDIKENIDQFSRQIDRCKSIHPGKTYALLKNARRMTLQFETSTYVDLYSFYNSLLKLMNKKKKVAHHKYFPQEPNNAYKKELTALRRILKTGQKYIKQAIVANIAGRKVKRAQGLSVYFPRKSIHSSYFKTNFAQESHWINFLKEFKQ